MVTHLIIKFPPAFYGIRMFIIVLTRPRQWSVFSASLIYFIPHLTLFLWINFNIILSFPPTSLKRSSRFLIFLPYLLSHHVYYMSRQSHSLFDHHNDILWFVQVTELLIMHFSLFFCHFLSVMSKYFPQPHVWRPHSKRAVWKVRGLATMRRYYAEGGGESIVKL
jgi:hypothetical protein